MQRRRLGEDGPLVSVVGLGCASFGRQLAEAEARTLVECGLELGVNFFDTADVYGTPPGTSESILGTAVSRVREEVVLATKLGFAPGHPQRRATRANIRSALEASLTRLGTEYIDLFQLHFPDVHTCLDETLGVLDELIAEGKVRYAGCSNHPAWMLADAAWRSRVNGWCRFVSCQLHYNLLHRDPERELLPACVRFGIGAIAYHPLAKGLLTGRYDESSARRSATLNSRQRYRDWCTLDNWRKVRLLAGYAESRGRSMTEVAMGFLLAQDGVATVLLGPTSVGQLQAGVRAAQWRPSASDLTELDHLITRTMPEYESHMMGAGAP